ncbi:MAG: type II toxin-antitoxin system HicB family antitoxin, partial [Burkholderiales bacterium]|nr:type II toxin-antitoxin system HicB family antitoxin [Burkholderiales bacterium]
PFKHPSKPRSRDHGGKAKRRLRTRYIEQYPQAVWSEEVRPKIRYAIVIEKADSNYSAYVPDLPGCVATGATVEEVESRIREATEFHLEGMRKDGVPVPAPVSKVEDVEIAA